MVLEAVLSSGSHAILHTCNEEIFPGVEKIPFARFGLPHLARFMFPLYLPGMLEPIHSVSKIQSGLPFFIMHCEKDFQLSIEGAIGIHGGLLSKGNPSVLAIKPGRGHVLMLDSRDGIGDQVNKFFKENNLPAMLSLQNYSFKNNTQPKDEDAKKVYAKLVKENNQEFVFGACVNIAIVCWLLKLIAFFVF